MQASTSTSEISLAMISASFKVLLQGWPPCLLGFSWPELNRSCPTLALIISKGDVQMLNGSRKHDLVSFMSFPSVALAPLSVHALSDRHPNVRPCHFASTLSPGTQVTEQSVHSSTLKRDWLDISRPQPSMPRAHSHLPAYHQHLPHSPAQP